MTDRVINSKPKKEHIDNSKLLADSGLKIVHINNNRGADTTFRAMTVAYEQINKSHLKISTAVTHRSDTFTKKLGTRVAIQNFEKGNVIVVPIQRYGSIADQLRGMFGYIQS